ncbi:sensor histidine kinase [Lysobacter yangpyeongensis]|uniref:histidine kinase n=1 Tax=Lysobacter yangpyeongensis TaxID=346182 RepID=A0ABW0SL21_9GAMM
MPQGLPRKVKLAFVAQALIASVVLCLVMLAVGLAVRQTVVTWAAHREAEQFWSRHAAAGNAALLSGRTFHTYFAPAASGSDALPPTTRDLPEGLNQLSLGSFAYIEDRPSGRFVATIDTELIDVVIIWTVLCALLFALVISYAMAWLTYRTTKRMVVPVSWLADVVAHWDPRAPDTSVIREGRLPPDSGSEVRQLTAALTDLGDRVTDFVQRERDFTRDASHELRTPLTVIRVATDLMLADPDASERQVRSLARVQRAGRDMEAVIDAFLILAREAEVEPLSEEFDVREIVGHEVARVQPLLSGRPIELDVIDQGAPRLFAPPHVLAVMVGNLLGNAVRFTDAGRIELVLMPDRIVVRDTGIGMSRETLIKAFDPFYRADPAREEGRGMGLSIVRRLGERFGWPVSLDSQPGKGTVATIRFA